MLYEWRSYWLYHKWYKHDKVVQCEYDTVCPYGSDNVLASSTIPMKGLSYNSGILSCIVGTLLPCGAVVMLCWSLVRRAGSRGARTGPVSCRRTAPEKWGKIIWKINKSGQPIFWEEYASVVILRPSSIENWPILRNITSFQLGVRTNIDYTTVP